MGCVDFNFSAAFIRSRFIQRVTAVSLLRSDVELLLFCALLIELELSGLIY